MRMFSCLLLFAMLVSTGCVERRIYVRTDPVDAEVYIDGEFIGRTRPDDHRDGPLYANFIYYGTREFTIRKPGYQTQSGRIDLVVPWYEYPPIDFFAEVLTPWIIVDKHYVEVKLERAGPANVETLYRNAQNYRSASRPQERYEYDFLWGYEDTAPRE